MEKQWKLIYNYNLIKRMLLRVSYFNLENRAETELHFFLQLTWTVLKTLDDYNWKDRFFP